LDVRADSTTGEISDKVLRLPLGNSLSSLRTPLQTQWAGVAARLTNAQKRHCPLSVDAFLSSTVRPYGGCARDTLGYAGSIGNRSANLRTAATLHRVAAISGGSTYMSDFAFELDRTKREGALGVAQLIGLAKLLADRVLEDSEHLMA